MKFSVTHLHWPHFKCSDLIWAEQILNFPLLQKVLVNSTGLKVALWMSGCEF